MSMANAKGNDSLTMIFAATAATMVIGHLMAAKTARDALFLTHFDVTDLPKMMIATAILSALAVVTFSKVLTRFGPARVIPPLYLASGLVFVGEWVVLAILPRIFTVVLYLHISVFGSLLISGFWSIMNERWDPYTAKQAISRLASFAVLGGLLGAAAANGLAKLIDTRAIVALLALLHGLVGVVLYQVIRGHSEQQPRQAPAQTGGLMTIVRHNTLIQRMALLILSLATSVALLDYLLKSQLQATLSKEELVSFFSFFYMGIGITSFLLQTFVGSKALRLLGLGGTMAVLPLTVLFGGVVAMVYRSLVTATLLRASAGIMTNTLFKSGFELLFTPISQTEKRASKILIDVGADRSGDMLGSLLVMGILLIPGPTDDYLLATAMLLAGAMSLLIVLLHRGYIAQLANNLRSGTLDPSEIEIKDATTAHTVALTRTSLERDKLLREISRSRGSSSVATKEAVGVSDAPPAGSGTAPAAADMNPELETIWSLHSQDESRIRHALTHQAVSPVVLPHVLPLLRNETVLKEALNAAKPLASVASGQLVDALLDRQQHPLIRRRVPLLLGLADNERAVQGLMLGLQDPEVDVRFRCAEALGRIKRNYSHLPMDANAVWQVVHREITRLKEAGYQPRQGVEPLAHLFKLFGIVFGLDVMQTCYDSLESDDQTLRGTALEYLENQLPQDVRATLWPVIASNETVPKSNRSAQEILKDLRKAVPLLRRVKRGNQESRDDE